METESFRKQAAQLATELPDPRTRFFVLCDYVRLSEMFDMEDRVEGEKAIFYAECFGAFTGFLQFPRDYSHGEMLDLSRLYWRVYQGLEWQDNVRNEEAAERLPLPAPSGRRASLEMAFFALSWVGLRFFMDTQLQSGAHIAKMTLQMHTTSVYGALDYNLYTAYGIARFEHFLRSPKNITELSQAVQKKYGGPPLALDAPLPLACHVCEVETEMADPELGLAFCGPVCHASHLGCLPGERRRRPRECMPMSLLQEELPTEEDFVQAYLDEDKSLRLGKLATLENARLYSKRTERSQHHFLVYEVAAMNLEIGQFDEALEISARLLSRKHKRLCRPIRFHMPLLEMEGEVMHYLFACDPEMPEIVFTVRTEKRQGLLVGHILRITLSYPWDAWGDDQ